MKKTLNKIFLFSLIVFIFSNNVLGQVYSRSILPEKSSKFSIGLLPTSIKDRIHKQLNFTKEKEMLLEDSIENLQNVPYRFGAALDVNIDLIKESSSFKERDSTFFIYRISSPKAKSLNIIFDQFKLSPRSSLIIYNVDETVVFGPVTAKNNTSNEVFWSDVSS